MIDAAESIAQFFTGRTRSDLDSDRMLLFAIVRAIEVIKDMSGGVSHPVGGSSPSGGDQTASNGIKSRQ
jgi:uncharacterized protein with HEPN domain